MLKRTLFFTTQAFLSVEMAQLIVEQRQRDGERVKKSMPIEDLGCIVIESPQVTVTTYCLQSLVENKTAVIFCDEKHMPNALLLPMEGHTTLQEQVENQLLATDALKQRLWRQTVQAKIINQALCLESIGKEAGKLRIIAKNVKKGDEDNAEAVAARIYFQRHALIRDANAPAHNAALNYGYALIRGAVARALASSGLLCCVGIHHCNRYNAFCLADDIMEPYRPFVDQLVFSEKGAFAPPFSEELTKEMKMQLLSLLACDVFMNEQTRPLMNAISLTTASLARCFAGKEKEILYPTLTF